MGSLSAITPAISEYIVDLITYNDRVYALATDSGNTYHIIYRLNQDEDNWETIATFPFYNLTKFFIFNGILLMYPWIGDPWGYNYYGNVYRLNETYDGVDLVVDDPTRTSFLSFAEYNGRLYVSSIDPNTFCFYLIRLNNSMDGWETICDGTPIGKLSSLVEFNGRLCVFVFNYVTYYPELWNMNLTEDGIEYICTFNVGLSESAHTTSIVFNDSLYYVTYNALMKVNAEETGSITVATEPDYNPIYDLFLFKGYLHMIDPSLNRLNEDENGINRIISGGNVRRRAVLDDKLFLTCGDGQFLYKYSSITSVSLVANRTVSMTTVPINFYNTSETDYPATYYWEFGDSGTDIVENPSYAYSISGTFDITITVTCGYDVLSYTYYGYITIYDYFHKYIYTVDDLQLIGSGGPDWPDYGDYELANDIDASSTTGWDDGFGNLGFLPIPMFRGILNGANYTISGLYMNNTSDAAMFYTVDGASFLDLNFENISIYGSGFSATLFVNGSADGPQYISNCSISGDFFGYSTAVFSGTTENYNFVNCSSTPTFSHMTYGYIGGICFEGYGCDFIDCFCSFSIEDEDGNGTYAGICLTGGVSSYRFSTVSGCHTVLNVGNSSYTGGISINFEGIITDSHVDGYIRSRQYAGGMVVWFTVRGPAENLYTHCDVISDQNQTGGLFGVASTGHKGYYTFSNCYSTGNVRSYWRVGGLTGESVGIDYVNCYSTGDISLHFSGGIVGAVNSGSCTNCYAIGNVRGNYSSGGLVGQISSGVNIINCYSLGEVTYGHLPGEYYEGDEATYIGGFIGYGSMGESIIENCFCVTNVSQHVGTVEALSRYVGGFMGALYGGHLVKCFSKGNATGNTYVGGFIGYNFPGYNNFDGIYQCFSLGDVVSAAGKIGITDVYIGGFISYFENGNVPLARIKDCFSRGNVINYYSGENKYIGGFIGYCRCGSSYDVEISNCYSTGNVSDDT